MASLVRELGTKCASNATVLQSAVNNFVKCGQVDADVLRPISLLVPRILSLAGYLEQVYQQASGYSSTFTFMEFSEIDTALSFATTNNLSRLYDGWIMQPGLLSELSSRGALMPLDSLMAGDTALNWTDFHPFFLKTSAAFGGHIVGVPLTGSANVMYYRRDLFEARNWPVPNTWDEVLLAAQALNDTDLDGDGKREYALCFQVYNNCFESGYLLGQILAPMTQYQGIASGWLFDPNTLQPFVSGPAMAHALQLYRSLLPYMWPDTSCSTISERLQANQCAITIRAFQDFKVAAVPGSITGNRTLAYRKLGTALMPGHAHVYSRSTGKLTPCNATLCPYADRVINAQTGAVQWVNRAPFFGAGSYAGMVNAQGDAGYHQAAYGFFSLLSGSAFNSLALLYPEAPLGPVRLSQMMPWTLPMWVAHGYPLNLTAEVLAVWVATLNSPNIALDLRLPGSSSYMAVIQAMANNASLGILSNDQIMAEASTEFGQLVVAHGGVGVGLDGYRASIGLAGVPIGMTPGAAGSNSLSLGELVAVIVIPTIFVLVCALLALKLWRRGGLRLLKGEGRSGIPGAGPDTALMVSDVESSTTLWELLPVEVMNRVMKTHNDIFRALVVKHDGYESQTEGDSFIMSFHQPQQALQFCIEVQDTLMAANWPQELLALPACAEFWVTQTHHPRAARADIALTWGGPAAPRDTLFSWYSKVKLKRSGRSSTKAAHLKKSLTDVHLDSGGGDSPGSDAPLAAYGRGLGGKVLPRVGSRGSSGQDSARRATEALWDCVDEPEPEAHPTLFSINTPRTEGNSNNALNSTGEPTYTVKAHYRRMWREEVPLSAVLISTLPLSKIDGSEPDVAANEPPNTVQQEDFHSGVSRVLAFRGLRVRMGMSCGFDAGDVAPNKTTMRTQYGGTSMHVTRAVSDAAQGGMVLVSEAVFKRLLPEGHKDLCLMMNAGEYLLNNDLIPPIAMYQAIGLNLIQRCAFLGPIRSRQQLQAGVDDAPMGFVTVVFMNVVGISMLLSWNKDVASDALDIYHHMAVHQLRQFGGYLIELSDGLCLAGFRGPEDAVRWACTVVHLLKEADWSEELLAHELCEPMAMGVVEKDATLCHHTTSHAQRLSDSSGDLAPPPAVVPGVWNNRGVLLFRGLRLKVGLDIGQVKAVLNCASGRMTYRGRCMNRAARMASIAAAGQVVCSSAVWDACEANEGHVGLIGNLLGAHALKGIPERVMLYSCQLDLAAAVVAAPSGLPAPESSFLEAVRATSTMAAAAAGAATPSHAQFFIMNSLAANVYQGEPVVTTAGAHNSQQHLSLPVVMPTANASMSRYEGVLTFEPSESRLASVRMSTGSLRSSYAKLDCYESSIQAKDPTFVALK